ncbi:uncharacterized protein LOC121812696 [Haplochromis burtoni]|uniref:uncharacterized protein LOC121812696 n=1 Tax=Haplochromis burtoni TaxID=8153 RepID=UPI001C2CE4D2|nr:uncharacterized protein LOC121812696 [Haplochromis burtoni]
MPILCDIVLFNPVLKRAVPARCYRAFGSDTAERFSILFDQFISYPPELSISDGLVSCLDSACKSVLDAVAPFIFRQCKPKASPWLTDFTRAARKECRRCERRWKKDRLCVSMEALKTSWKVYQRAVKAAKHSYFSQLIAASSHNPRVLYNTINSVLNPEGYILLHSSAVMCNKFLNYFVEKVASLRPPTLPIADPAMHGSCSSLFSAFLPIVLWLDCLTDVKAWMAKNFLNFNDRKTEAILFGPNRSSHILDVDLAALTSQLKSSITNLGVKIDSALTFDDHVNGVVKSAFYHLRRAAAGFLTGRRKFDHIPPILASLHWLPIEFRIRFKVL